MRSHQSPRLKPTHAFAKFPSVNTSLSRSYRFPQTTKGQFCCVQNCPDGRRSNSRLHVVKIHYFRQSRGNVIHTPFIIALLAYFVNGKRQKMIVIFYTNLDVSYKILCFEEKQKTRCIIWRDFEPTRKRACGEAVRTSPSQKNKRLSESKNQPVILSRERSSQSNFCGLSVCEQAEARGIFAEAGYGLKSR